MIISRFVLNRQNVWLQEREKGSLSPFSRRKRARKEVGVSYKTSRLDPATHFLQGGSSSPRFHNLPKDSHKLGKGGQGRARVRIHGHVGIMWVYVTFKTQHGLNRTNTTATTTNSTKPKIPPPPPPACGPWQYWKSVVLSSSKERWM